MIICQQVSIMLKINFILTLFLLNFSNAQNWIKSGYCYSGSDYPVPDINSALYTHLLCAFAHINASNYEIYISSTDESYMSTFTEIVRQKNPSVTTLLSIWGGEANSSKFFEMVAQPANRLSFIESSIKIARTHGFQGLDLFAVQPNTPINMANMGIFLDEWRAAVDSQTKNSSASQLILTMGSYYSPEMEHMKYPISSISKNFDWVHVISFDYYLPGRDKFTGAHAALYDPLSRLNTDYGLKEWIRGGMPANKLVLGLPFHGYVWTLADPNDNAIGAPAKGLAITQDGSMGYRLIKWFLKNYDVQPEFNSTYAVNYCQIGSSWIGFDDVEAIKTKVSYAKEKGLLGYNVFQVPNDDEHWLLSRAAQEAEQDQQSKKKLLAIILPIIFLATLLTSATIFCWQRDSIMSKVRGKPVLGRKPDCPSLQIFTFTQIEAATDKFSCENQLGRGGFGPVYKGRLHDGREIAVKRLSESSKQGTEEFENEVRVTASLQHVNLVRLLGFCTEREEKMLIYEYMQNGSLDTYLFDPVKSTSLDWEKRVQIIEGVTQGLLYLQEYSTFTVIHRDLKASNILLDNEMKPKISDFGLARTFQKDKSEGNTRRIVGTYGYVPPEYVKRGIYSRKYDIYSFGVLLLQIISGKKTTCLYGIHQNLNLLEYAYELWINGNGMNFMDHSLDDATSACKLLRCMHVALLCVQERWEARPSIVEVFSMLANKSDIVDTPSMPAFSTSEGRDKEKSSTPQEGLCSVNNMTISQTIPR